jgi:glycosyltransferase involved in cell wall biosynthesis
VQVTLVIDSLQPRLSGIGRYTWELCRRIPDQPEIDAVHYFANGRLVRDPKLLLDGGASRRGNRLRRWIDRQRSTRLLERTLVHGPNYFLPPNAETGIITVHDLSVFRHPETHPPERRKAFERKFHDSLNRALHVITDTETVRRELLGDFAIPEQKVSAIPLGVDPRYRPIPEDRLRRQLAPFGLEPSRYALCVSTLEPRKKIAELLDAWRALPATLRDSTPLVLAGAEGWLNQGLHEQIRDAAASGWLKHVGFVPEESLPALYAGAALFLYPSLYEGFGLPPLEAMASGAPVVVANRSCLPEVCGDAAAYVDPDDLPAFTGAIAEALENHSWQARAREKGLERAARFTWESCAARTAEVYRKHAR